MARPSAALLELARKGAEYRWQELQAELSALAKTFPHLTGLRGVNRGRRATAPVSRRQSSLKASATPAQANDAAEVVAPPARRKARWTPAMRRAAAARMRAFWAKRKRAEK
jgi:hypothetical protein